MTLGFTIRLTILVLASFLGVEVTRRIGPERRQAATTLATLISGVIAAGAILVAGQGETRLAAVLGFLAVGLAGVNVTVSFLLGARASRGANPPASEPPTA